MARIILKGLPKYDGDYELDANRPFNGLEWRWVKRISGYMPMTMRDGFAGADPDLFIALAVIAMWRDRKITKDEALTVADTIAEAYGVEIDLTDDPSEVEDDIPLASTPPPVELLRSGSS